MCSILGYCSTGVSEETVAQMLSRTISRGPDDTRLIKVKGGYLGFNRLSIMGLTEEGMQPFERNGRWCICNGEIYGFRDIKKDLESKGYEFRSDSDCELLLPMYELYGTKMFAMLDAEFALVIYDGNNDTWIAARDPIGIRPLYYGYDNDDQIVFASEPKNLVGVCGRIYPFPPGYYYKDGHFMYYRDISEADSYCYDDLDTISVNIHDKLLRGIEKRLDSDTPVGFLLSGGLDSSLVCGAAAKLLDRPIETFAIGMDIDAIDLKYAREVADYIHPTISPPSAPPSACICCADGSTNTPISRYCSPVRFPMSCSATNIPILRRTQRNFRKKPARESTRSTCTMCCVPTAASA